jgi:hypothetical protein
MKGGPAIITCTRCGHRATTRARGFPALGADDLAGKMLVCTACGTRQRFDLAHVDQAAYRRRAAPRVDEPGPRAEPAGKRRKMAGGQGAGTKLLH